MGVKKQLNPSLDKSLKEDSSGIQVGPPFQQFLFYLEEKGVA